MQKELENSKLVHWLLSIASGVVITLVGFFIAIIPGAPPISRVGGWLVRWPEWLLPSFLLDPDEGFLLLLLWNVLLYSVLTSLAIRIAKKYKF
jgi:hypothetical protein